MTNARNEASDRISNVPADAIGATMAEANEATDATDATDAAGVAAVTDAPTAELTHRIIGVGIEVHRHLGPGHLEAAYVRAMCLELARRDIPFRYETPIKLMFKGVIVGDYFADLIVADRVLIEVKSVASIAPPHIAQMLSYLAATKLHLGLVMNFNVHVLARGGIKRVIR